LKKNLVHKGFYNNFGDLTGYDREVIVDVKMVVEEKKKRWNKHTL
jgi:hypothetical protein